MPEEQQNTPQTDINLTEPPTLPQEPAKEPEDKKLLAGKYKTAEELEKAYKELEGKLGEKQPAPQPDKQPEDGKPPMTVAGLPAQKYFDEYAQTGGLSDESYKELEGKGIPREIVDAYIEGAKARAERNTRLSDETSDALINEIGGKETFGKMAAWALNAYSEQEKRDYQAAIESGNPAIARFALQSLKAKYEAAFGASPSLVEGQPAAGTASFRSKAEMVKAMRDPRYKTDPAYRAEVERKVAGMKM